MTAQRTYLDHNATTPLRAEARAAMVDAMELVGNPSSVHGEGRRARAVIEDARGQVAALVGARPREVVFGSGGTEANNWVLSGGWDFVVVSAMEHDSVLEPARASGGRLLLAPAHTDGVVDLQQLEGLLEREAGSGRGLVSVHLANNETGAIQPVRAVCALAKAHGLAVHTDAVQAAGKVSLNFAQLGVDFLTLSAHKLGGPKGVGALIVREGSRLEPALRGGGQELRMRAGTENVPGIAGFGAAAAAALGGLQAFARVKNLRERLERAAISARPDAVVVAREVERLPNTSSMAVPGTSAETLVIGLDLAGIAVSAGAACSSGKVKSSHVLAAMGLPAEIAQAAIRVSLGPDTSERDIDEFLSAWVDLTGTHAEQRKVA